MQGRLALAARWHEKRASSFPGRFIMCWDRDDRREEIFRDELDRGRFVETLGEAHSPPLSGTSAKSLYRFDAFDARWNHSGLPGGHREIMVFLLASVPDVMRKSFCDE